MCFKSYRKACCYYYKAQYNKYLLNSYLVQKIVLDPGNDSETNKTRSLSSGSLQFSQMVKINNANNWTKMGQTIRNLPKKGLQRLNKLAYVWLWFKNRFVEEGTFETSFERDNFASCIKKQGRQVHAKQKEHIEQKNMTS